MPFFTTFASMRVAALPNAPGPIWITFLNFFSLYPLIKAARSIGRSLVRMPTARRLSTTDSPILA